VFICFCFLLTISPAKHNHFIPRKFWAFPQVDYPENNMPWVLADAVLGIVTIEGQTYLILITSKVDVGSIYGDKIYRVAGTTFVTFQTARSSVAENVWLFSFFYFFLLLLLLILPLLPKFV
jgi:hypothetical protein